MLMVTGCSSSFFPAVSHKHGSSHSFVVPTQVYLQLLTEFLKLVDLTGWLHARLPTRNKQEGQDWQF
ncbi:hypothetical protein AV530_005885 [Patagioenas fasciata monilis]|uniref:Uncharacterized protein n=1 Tax=Patagioenas fasciata monilis TaxID=372326 RepID=A0A1V4JMZ1_PATFA|nr:hypothetical protein AV530_005885 [Patagioenas fasciata monilis]